MTNAFLFLLILHNNQQQHQDEFQHNKIHRGYGVLRRADLYPLSRDCLFLIWKDIGITWQRFHRRKCRVGCSLEGVRVWIGEGMMCHFLIFIKIIATVTMIEQIK